MSGRPRTAIGTYGTVRVWRSGRGYTAETRYRDVDGRLRKVKASNASRNGAAAAVKERLKTRPGYGSGGLLTVSSPFTDLAELWLADLEGRDIGGHQGELPRRPSCPRPAVLRALHPRRDHDRAGRGVPEARGCGFVLTC
jgi:hypothetical protein